MEGLLLVDKPQGKTSFSLVSALRRHLGVKKIGHAGTLDPMATGLMVMLIGKNYTKLSDQFLGCSKEYEAEITCGFSTDSYDMEGAVQERSSYIPTLEEVKDALRLFQGKVEQVPPMFSAKKINGKKLYELAREGKQVERKSCIVELHTEFISYEYPIIKIWVRGSKGTYIRSIAHDLGLKLGCFGTLSSLRRLASGPYHINNGFDGSLLFSKDAEVKERIAGSLLKNPILP